MDPTRLDQLYTLHQSMLDVMQPRFRRDDIDRMPWGNRGVAVVGARGVGKTTLLMQYIKERHYTNREALYISLDHVLTLDISLYDLAQMHYDRGGRYLYIDEIHKYEQWSIHIKSIYDTFLDMTCVISGSSILQIYKGDADLSRRFIKYELHGLSLREYIQVETGRPMPVVTLQDIVSRHTEVCSDIGVTIDPLIYVQQYYERGYYPTYLEGLDYYAFKLNSIINAILEVDLPVITSLPPQSVLKIKRLLAVIARSVPFKPNITHLGRSLDISRVTLYQYLNYLESASIIHQITTEDKSYKTLTKPDKILLHNTNLAHALAPAMADIGSSREMFFVSQVRAKHAVYSSPVADFMVDNQVTIEVGGPGKKFRQIAGVDDSYLAVDDLVVGSGRRIPLWLFGFLY